MVRAAVSGAMDYARYDPANFNCRLKHRLVLQEIQRREEVLFLSATHQQWLAYVAHGQLTEESFHDVKKSTNAALDDLQSAIFPWRELRQPDLKNDTISGSQNDADGPQLDDETQKMIAQYKEWQSQLTSTDNGQAATKKVNTP